MARALTAYAADLIVGYLAVGRPVVVLHGGAVEAAEIAVELEQRGSDPFPHGELVGFVHRSGGASALRAAAHGALGHGGEPALLVVHPLTSGTVAAGGGCAAVDDTTDANPWSSVICLMDAEHAAAGGLGTLLGHPVVTVNDVEIRLDRPEGRLLVVTWLLEMVGDAGAASRIATSDGLKPNERATVEEMVRRRHASPDRASTAEPARPAGELARSAISQADGRLEDYLAACADALGRLVVLEDTRFRPVAWAPRSSQPLSVSQRLSAGRLVRLAGNLTPGVPEIVRLGVPSAGTIMVLRLGTTRPMGYLSIDGFGPAGDPDLPDATIWAEQLAPLLAGELARRESWGRLRSESQGQLITMLVQGLLSPRSAELALEIVVGVSGVRVAAVCSAVDPSDDPEAADPGPVRRGLDRLHVPYGEFQGLTVALLRGEEGAVVRLAEQLDDLPVALGVGSLVGDQTDLPTSARQAAWACRLALATGRRVLDFAEVGIHRLFLPGAEGGDPSFEEPIRRLEERDDLGFDAMATLSGYLDAGGNVRQTAERLLVHANTLRYRLHRLAEVMDVDPSDPEQRFRLQLAVRLRAGRRALRETGGLVAPEFE